MLGIQRVRRIGRILLLICMAFMLSFCKANIQKLPHNTSVQQWNGKKVSLADYQGKWLVLNYWAIWCAPCREELPALEAFYQKHHERVEVIGISMDPRDSARMPKIIEDFGLTYPLVVEDPLSALEIDISYMPTTIVVNPAGEIISQDVKVQTLRSLERATKQSQSA